MSLGFCVPLVCINKSELYVYLTGRDLNMEAPMKLNAFWPKEDLVIGRLTQVEEQDQVWCTEVELENSRER
jgi:hypothetical protein